MSGNWQRYVLASSGYLELGMLDDAALAFEEIAPEDKNRNEVLGARVNLYMAVLCCSHRDDKARNINTRLILASGYPCSG